MRRKILKVLCSLILVSGLASNLISCGSSNETTQQSGRHSRKPQVSAGNTQQETTSVYKDGEIVSLADGSKIKYNANGDHEIIEQGDGKVIIFKNVTDDVLNSLNDDERAMVERQMESDPNGFALIY